MAKVIAVANSKGGTGKTTVAENIALYLVYFAGQKVLYIDNDSQRSGETFFADRAERLGRHDVACVAKTYSKGLAREIRQLGENYDFVICDVGGSRDSDVMRQVLLAAHEVIVPTRVGQPDLDSLRLFMAIVDEVRGVNERLRCCIVINQAPTDTFDTIAQSAKQGLAEMYGNDAYVCQTVLKLRKAWLRSTFDAHAIWEFDKNSTAANEFAAFVEELQSQGVMI